MDLASLSLGQIASLLSPKQQEVLLASISVAANFIQQIQQEEQERQNQQLQQEDHHQYLNDASCNDNDNEEDDDDDDDDEEELEDQDSIIDCSNHDSITEHCNNLISQTNNHYKRENGHHTSTTSETDEDDLTTIRLFAEELKQRRKSIRLSQKGAAQSLRAFTGGVQPCTDAIIYHFENLQLEPERAMQLIPLLKDWLDWAEKHRLNGKQLPMMSAVTKVPRERKRKVVLFNEKAKHYLEDAFAKNNHPDRYQLDVISQELNIPTRSIRKWFTNRRQRKRFAEKFNAVGNTSSNSI